VELYELTFSEARRGLEAREFSSSELVSSVLDRIEAVEPKTRALLYVHDRGELLDEASAIDAARSSGDPLGPIAGVPVVIKDNIATKGIPTTAASRILSRFAPPYDATAVERLRAAGGVIVGKANMDEFAMGSSNENSAFVAARNPWDLARVPGGSSGGSAAAVAAGEAVLSLGSDTGGSVRQPSGFCGVVGVKPTYGRVSRYGLIAFASSLDQIGPVSRDVEGAAALLGAVAGEDPRDSTTGVEPVPDYLSELEGGCSGFTLGVPEEYFSEGLSPDVESAVRGAIDVLAAAGANVRSISLPHAEHGISAYYVVADAEASSNLARYDGIKYDQRACGHRDLFDTYCATRSEGFGREVKRRIMLGTYALSAGYRDEWYLKAQKVRALIAADFARAFDEVDAVVGPTSPTRAFEVGARIDDPIQMYLADVYTTHANLAGIAAISVPCDPGDGGLPVGFQIMVDKFQESAMFRIARAYERAAGLGRGVPEL
jgi:aspartyl-tRNA(Asn)/glutamyl-tRNA(Gln) amidotransferase subunit A